MDITPLDFKFPVHVSLAKVEGKEIYHLKPLFFAYSTMAHRRFEGAMSKIKSSILNTFKGWTLDYDSFDEVLWMIFHPKIDFQVLHLTVPLKGRLTKTGKFGIAVFNVRNHTFACLPKFQNFIFMVSKNEKNKFNLEEQAAPIIGKLLQRYQEEDIESYDFSNYTSTSKEFITEVEVTVQIGHEKYGFQPPANSFAFANANFNQEGMVGANQIWNVSKNLNNLYPNGIGRAFFQEQMVTRMSNLLFKKPFENTPIAIIGEEGIGKKSIVHESLYLHLSSSKKHKRTIWHIDPTRIITGMSIVGMWQKRMESVLGFLKNPYNANKGSDIMLVDNAIAMLHIGKSAQNNMTVNDVLKPYLEKREIQMVIIATPQEWKIVQEKDRRFADLFQTIRLQEPDLDTAVKMALENRKVLESINDCQISVKAVQSIFDFRRNYLKRKSLPGSVIKIIRQLAVKYRGEKIDVPEVRAEFEVFSGLNQNIFDAPSPVKEDEIREKLAEQLVGQPQAVMTLANVIHTIKARLTDKNKPLGSFMFIGPTGVGKTQAAKVLSKYLTGNEASLMQFDMNEFIDYTAVQRLIGDAQNPEGQLTGKVRYRPFGIVLLDEIEKAHPKVLDLLLQILDDARLTDSLGRTIDFSNTIIIMTSNEGASRVSAQAGFKTSKYDESSLYTKAIENKFRPEFINRIDEIVIFNPLEMDHILDIASLQIKELLSRDGFVRRTTILNISPEALEWVARRGFNSKMGGRALKRQIEKDLTALTAAQLVSNYTKKPILFEIFLENNRLVPVVKPLEFISEIEDWFPELPKAIKGKGFYMRLIRTLEAIEKRIQRMESKNQKNPVIVDPSKSFHYSFKEKIAETKERLTHLSLGFRDRKFHMEPAIPLRLKGSSKWGNSDKLIKGNFKDYFFQQEGLAEISEIYHRAKIQYNSIETEFLNSFLMVSFLKLFSKDFLKGPLQKATLRFESCVNNTGQIQIEYLFELYCKLLDYLDIEKEVDTEKQYIHIKGYSLAQLFEGEEGIHLFHIPYKNPIPIKVILETENKVKIQSLNQVIRVYDHPNTLTDFRTNFTNASNITVEEFSLLVYAGLNPKIRKKVS